MAARRQRLVVLLSLFLLGAPWAIFAQKTKLPLRVNVLTYPNRPRLGDDFQIILRVNEPRRFSNRVFYTKDNFPKQLSMLGGPYIKPAGEASTDYIYLVKANEIGQFVLPSFTYTNGIISQRTQTQTIEILPRDPNSEEYKIQGAYRSPPLSVYQGQAFGLVLEVKNLNELMPVGTQNLPPIANAIIENAPGFGSITEHKFRDDTLYNVPVMAWIVATGSASKLTLPSMTLKAGTQTTISPSVSIDVLPLPKEVSESNAVGSFRLTSEISDKSVTEDGFIELKIRLEGEGNFHILNLPQPLMSENVEIAKQSDMRVLMPTTRGYSGYIESTYQIKPTADLENHRASVTVPEFNSWDPYTLLLNKQAAAQYHLEIITNSQNTNLFAFFSPAAVMMKKDFSIFRILGLWMLLLPLFLWKLLGIITKPKDKPVSFFLFLPLFIFPFISYEKVPETLRRAEQYVQDENWPAAQQAFAETIKFLPRHKAVLMYNQAIAMQKQDQVGWTSYYLVKAIEYDPFEPIYRKAWHSHQKQFKLSSSTIRAGFDYSLYIYYALFVMAFGLLLMGVLVKKNLYIQRLGFILTGILIFIFLTMLTYQVYGKKSWAVALQDTSLGRIPEKDVLTLYVVKEGTLLEVMAKFDDFYLLTNQSEGIEGWATVDKFVLGQERK